MSFRGRGKVETSEIASSQQLARSRPLMQLVGAGRPGSEARDIADLVCRNGLEAWSTKVTSSVSPSHSGKAPLGMQYQPSGLREPISSTGRTAWQLPLSVAVPASAGAPLPCYYRHWNQTTGRRVAPIPHKSFGPAGRSPQQCDCCCLILCQHVSKDGQRLVTTTTHSANQASKRIVSWDSRAQPVSQIN